MSEAERRRWALESIRYGERMAIAGGGSPGRIDIFEEADALIAYINGGTAEPESLSRVPSVARQTAEMPDRRLREAM